MPRKKWTKNRKEPYFSTIEEWEKWKYDQKENKRKNAYGSKTQVKRNQKKLEDEYIKLAEQFVNRIQKLLDSLS